MKTLMLLLMLFSSVTFSGNASFQPQKDVRFAEISLQNSNNVDEFLSYWDNSFRLTPTCDVTYEQFNEMFQLYSALNDEEKQQVNETVDKVEPDYKISQIISTLVVKFNPSNSSGDSKKENLDQGTMIGIVAGVSVFGITAILIFYILKNKKVIK